MNPDKNDKNRGIVFLGIGFELVAMCVGGWFLGIYLDQYFGWTPNTAGTWLVLALMASWFVHLIYLLRKFERDDERESGPRA